MSNIPDKPPLGLLEPSPEIYATMENNPQGYAVPAYPHIRRFYRLPMVQVFEGTSNYRNWTYRRMEEDGSETILTSYSIPGSFGNEYLPRLEYRTEGGEYVEIVPGATGGQWYLDGDTGILTFYDYNAVSDRIHGTSIPYISFYRYEGNLGIQDPIVFKGAAGIAAVGDEGDQLAVVRLGDEDPTTLLKGTLGQALQFGGHFDGVWRIVPRWHPNPFLTYLEFQHRRTVDGIPRWKTQYRIGCKEAYVV